VASRSKAINCFASEIEGRSDVESAGETASPGSNPFRAAGCEFVERASPCVHTNALGRRAESCSRFPPWPHNTMKHKDLHTRWPHRWISPRAEAYQSPIHGTGVRAVHDIKPDEILLAYGGVIIPKSEIEEYWGVMDHVGIQISDGFFIVPTERAELEHQGIVNHSCDPNAGFASSFELVAMRHIKKGEEVTFDYAFCESVMESFVCTCGSVQCRKRITKDDWTIATLQEKYGRFFSPYLQKKLPMR